MTRSVYITNTASCLPNPPVDNDNMERILGQVGDRPSRARRVILRSNGIKTRHYAIHPATLEQTHTNASLTAEAVRQLGDEYFALGRLECLACGTSIADQLMPNHASMVHGELKLQPLEAVATSGVCLSGVAAINYAYMAVASGIRRNAVAAGSELSSVMMRAHNFSAETDAQIADLETRLELAFEKDFLRWMLSDGAGALLLESEPRSGQNSLRIDWLELLSYAGEIETCMYAGGVKQADGSIKGWSTLPSSERERDSVMAVKQDVKLLNENIVRYSVEKPLSTLMEKRKIKPSDYAYFLPHYSSGFFRDKIYAGMQRIGFDIPQERWYTNLTERGNSGSASIYIIIDELRRSGLLRAGDKLLCYIPESGRFAAGYMQLTVMP
jgi:3-oxoacyl-[acyl-carrier-protein] synthase III